MNFPIKRTIKYSHSNYSNRQKVGDGITVAISLYNYGKYIRNALESVYRQSHKAIELIVVDDCSSDNSIKLTLDWLKRKRNRFTGIKLIGHSQNYGLYQARNTAFEYAENEFVFVLDADNEIRPSALATLLKVCADENIACAYSQLEYFDSKRGSGVAGNWSKEMFSKGNRIDAMALIRKSAWKKVGGYSEMSGWEDYDFWCKFYENDLCGAFVSKKLCRYRVHHGSMLNTETNPQEEELMLRMTVRHPWLEL